MSIFWIIVIIIYSGISIYFGINPTKGTFIDKLNTSAKSKEGRITALSLLRYVGSGILLFIGLFFFLPAGLIGMVKQKIESWQIDNEIKKRERSGFQYHTYLGGMGVLKCKDCGHKDEIVSFLHGHTDPSWSKTGYQCQKCGKHVTLYEDVNTIPTFICDCGGELSRIKPLFCVSCKSRNLKFDLTLIT